MSEYLRNKQYNPTEWEDRVTDDESGDVLVPGTPVNEENLNNLESGMLLSHLDIGTLALFLNQQIRQVALEIDKYKNQRLLQGKETISNSISDNGYFRDSEPFVEVALEGHPQINAPDYDVQLSIDSASDPGAVGDLRVYEKTQNGFKVKMTGSAESVSFLWTLINPKV
ncbi:signal transduction protein [Halobacillus trueperi]|uniref:Signal transduction protein n=1 Tax=Halobacillus trueperi TaxID=156205 RepID=A0A3D8VM00_9BACI|nr:signal transduction protein [Halobacillus trueperi]RDY70332.1 signal transduction protein [Halobacillus trueperi]